MHLGKRPPARRRAFEVVGIAAYALGLAACGEPDRNFDADRAFAALVAQVEFGPRHPGSAGHDRALAYYVEHFEATADRVTVHRFEDVSPLDSSRVLFETVLANFNLESDQRILFGAHWDTRPVADQEEDASLRDQPILGANDGASGVAVLLEVATALAARPPSIGVDLALFDGEDSGVEGEPETYCLGSQRFVVDHVERKKYRPSFVVIVDMVGRRGTRIPKEGNSMAGAGFLVERIWELGDELGLTVLADSIGPAIMDDHVPFLRARIPAVDLIDLGDPDWHTLGDLPENCAPESLEEIGRLLLAIVRTAESAKSP